MNSPESRPSGRNQLLEVTDRELTETPFTEAELRVLAEDIVQHCPSLTQLLLAIGSRNRSSVSSLHGMN